MSKMSVMTLLMALSISIVIPLAADCGEIRDVLVSRDKVIEYEPEDSTLGPVYVMGFDIPTDAARRRLLGAFMEFYVDVLSARENPFENDTRVIEIYLLKEPFSGVIDSTKLVLPSHLVRNVRLGESRLLRWEVTDLVKGYIRDPSGFHGLLIGSLSGSRDGVFVVRDDILPQGALARIRLYLED